VHPPLEIRPASIINNYEVINPHKLKRKVTLGMENPHVVRSTPNPISSKQNELLFLGSAPQSCRNPQNGALSPQITVAK
jgi:hypothetical protein